MPERLKSVLGRGVLMLLLLVGAYQSAAPWLDCLSVWAGTSNIGFALRHCSLPEGPFPAFLPNALLSALFIGAAVWVLFRGQRAL